MPKLFEIGEALEALEAALLDSGGEMTPEIEAQWSELGNLEGDKLDGYALLIKSFEARRDVLKAEAVKLSEKAGQTDNASKRLKGRLGDYMRFRGVRQLKGPIYEAALTKNGGKPPLVLESERPEDFPEECRKVSVAIDQEMVRKYLAAGGDNLPAHLGEVGEHVRVR